jgi:hypothetical protein
MKKLFFVFCFVFYSITALCQKSMISYDDIRYLLHNNLQQADTFLTAKGYLITKKDNNNKNRKYVITLRGGTENEISLRLDGKRIFIELETNDFDQYNLVRESISQYINKDAVADNIQSYTVKDLGNIYITINDTIPYSPIRKDYDIQVVPDKHVTAYD